MASSRCHDSTEQHSDFTSHLQSQCHSQSLLTHHPGQTIVAAEATRMDEGHS